MEALLSEEDGDGVGEEDEDCALVEAEDGAEGADSNVPKVLGSAEADTYDEEADGEGDDADDIVVEDEEAPGKEEDDFCAEGELTVEATLVIF